MRKVMLLLLATAFVACESKDDTDYNGQVRQKTNKPAEVTTMEFDHMEYDFGKVNALEDNVHYFKVKNTGTKPLIIQNAKSSCGCTIPEKPEEPIAPGASYDLKVIFKPKESQRGTVVEKTITVTANTAPSSQQLKIKGDVNP